jgi:glycosyltransferase involved in cell wall biosynthesis
MKKIILIAYDLNPKLGSECGFAEKLIRIISKFYYIELFVDYKHKLDIDAKQYPNVNFNFINFDSKKVKFFKKMKLFNFSYQEFIKKSKPIIKKMISKDEFQMIHCLTPAGIHSYNDLYKFKLPILIGPVGGGLKAPNGFSKIFKSNWIQKFLRDKFYDWIIKKKNWKNYFINADKIIIGTEYLKTILPKETYKKSEIIFDTIIDINKFKSFKNKLKYKNNLQICYIGRLIPQKGSQILLEAFNEIVKNHSSIKLQIAGTGPLENTLKRYIKVNNLDERVTLLGRISHEEIIKLLNDSDIFCLPTLQEPGGGSILEAMACQLPVISSNYGGPAFSITDDCGIKIQPLNYNQYIEDLQHAIEKLINDNDLRFKMGKNGRKRVIEHFSSKAISSKIIKVYSSIIDKK